jgi:predicted transcriptional regulator
MVLHEYVVRTLMRDLVGHDHSPAAFIVFLYLLDCSQQPSRASLQVSYQEIADATGLSKSSVQSAIGRLVRRKLVGKTQASLTAIPVYQVHQPWQRS